jgi:hypothetical protein
MEFLVKLIKVKNTKDDTAREDLHSNCTHVMNDLWLFEGDEEALDEGIDFDIIDEQAIECHGDLSGLEIIEMVKDIYTIP